MPLDVDVAGEATKFVPQTTVTNKVRITGQVFLFDLEVAIFEVTFFADDEELKTEIWRASGQPLITIMTEAPVGSTRVAVLRELSKDIIQTVQSNPSLKDQLIEDGHLRISSGSLQNLAM